ncbi:MAG: hypothetical protein IIC74_06565, partial [Bacteroidetes bacterium]|nr:hypothetical protein [Bacteroidota bacterium]
MSPDTDKIIARGDIVRWTWKDTAPHTVTNAFGSTDTFDSGSHTELNYQYSRT